MFKYTRAVLDDTVNDLRFIWFVFCVATQVIYLGYITYAVIAKVGIFILNIILLIISTTYFIIFLILHKKTGKGTKRARQISKHTKTIIKLFINAIALGVAVYGIYCSATEIDGISIMLTTLMLIFWCAQVILEIIVCFFEKKINNLHWAMKKDVEPIMNVYDKVANTVRWVKGEERIEREQIPSKTESLLEKALDKFRNRKSK